MTTIRNTIEYDAYTSVRVSTVTKKGDVPGKEGVRIKWTEDLSGRRKSEAVFTRTDLANLIAARAGADGPGLEKGFAALHRIGLVREIERDSFRLTVAGEIILAKLLDALGLKPMPIPITEAQAGLLRKCRETDHTVRDGDSVELALLDVISAGWVTARNAPQDEGPRIGPRRRGRVPQGHSREDEQDKVHHYSLTSEGAFMLDALNAWNDQEG